MPDYATHQKVNAIVLVIFTTFSHALMITYDYTISLNHLIGALSFVISSWCLSPDLDTKSKPFYNWSYLRFIWTIFHKFSTHRGILHSCILGPVVLTFPVTIAMVLEWAPINLLIPIYAGIAAQIEIHIILDRICSMFKTNITKIN